MVDQREKGVVQFLFLVCKLGAFFSLVLGWNIDFNVLVKAYLPPGLIKCFAMITFLCFNGKQRRKHYSVLLMWFLDNVIIIVR